MAGFFDVLLRGVLLLLVSVAAGGLAWARGVLRTPVHAKPDAGTRAALRLAGAAALGAALAQAAVVALVAVQVAQAAGGGVPAELLETGFVQVAALRVALALALALTAGRLARRPGGPGLWTTGCLLAAALVVSSALLSHAAARIEHRALLLGLDAVHQLAVAVWVGGLAHLAWLACRAGGEDEERERTITSRFSTLALAAVLVLGLSGLGLAVLYVGDPGALLGTAYGVMVLTKTALLAATLGVAWGSRRLVVRAAAGPSHPALGRLVEVELGLAVTVLFAAASLTSLPPAVDVTGDRATLAEVAARFQPAWPRLLSPPVADLLQAADPLMAPPGRRTPVERAWSEYNHHWAGLFVLAMGLLALAERAGVRAARHWPLLFLGLAAFMFVRNDPRAWPLGPAGFWESMQLPDVLQHRAFVVLVVGFGIFEWAVRTGRLGPRPWSYVFPLLCAAGGALLLTHSHAMGDLKDEFLAEVSHAPLGVLGAFAGWARWLEVRLPQAGPAPGWIWRGCLTAVGFLLVLYREG
jgi:putative copper resistance protein D